MNRAGTFTALAWLWVATAAAQIAPPPLPSELQFPTYPLGPPVVALGGAGTAWAHDAAASLNPATLFHAPRVSIYHYEGFADYGGDHAAGSVRLMGRLAVGLSIRRLGWDNIIEDDVGVPTDGLRTGDAQYTFTFAASPLPALQIGVSRSRLISDNLGVRISATTWSVGAIVAHSPRGQLGIALLHAGPAAQGGGGDRYPLPTRIRAGIQQRILNRIDVVIDGAVPTRGSGAWSVHTGVEWHAPAFLVLRGGVESLASAGAVEREPRLAGGVGFVFGPFEVGLSTRFGGIAGSQEWFVGLDALRPRR